MFIFYQFILIFNKSFRVDKPKFMISIIDKPKLIMSIINIKVSVEEVRLKMNLVNQDQIFIIR